MASERGKGLKQEFVVEAVSASLRIDRYLSDCCEGMSRSYFQKLLKEEAVSVNKRIVKSNYKVAAGDRIVVEIPEAVDAEIRAEEIPLDIVYEDQDVIVVNKPKGMVVHPAAGHYTGTLVNGLMWHCKDGLSGINGVLRPGIVHRIDMDTTGLLIVCKNDRSHNCIARQLKEHSITRLYYALVHGRIKEEEGVVDAPVGRHPTDRKKMSIHSRNGKEAVTHYRVLERFAGYTYVECRLETGRTHQIRVHMASIGHPLAGDQVYSSAKTPYKLQGQTLHAGVLGFIHPESGEYMEFRAPLPEYFAELLKKVADSRR